MITTVKQAIAFLTDKDFRYKVRIEDWGENNYAVFSDTGLLRVANAASLISEANMHVLAPERQALIDGMRANTVRAKQLSDGSYLILWLYRKNNGEHKIFPFEPTTMEGALHNLEALQNHGYLIDPPDMIDQLQQAIQKENEEWNEQHRKLSS